MSTDVSHRDAIPARPTMAQFRAKFELIQDELNKEESTRLPLENLHHDGDDDVTKPPATTERTIRLREWPRRKNSDSSESDDENELKSAHSSHNSSSDDETAPDDAESTSSIGRSNLPLPSTSSSSFTAPRTSFSQRRATAETYINSQKLIQNETNRSVSDTSKRSSMPTPPSAAGANMLAFTSASSSSPSPGDHTPLQPATLSDYVDFDSWQSVDSCDPYGSQSELFNPDGSRKPVLAYNMLHRMIGLGVSQRVEGAEALNMDTSFNIQPSHVTVANEFLHQSQQKTPENVRLYSRIRTSTDPSRATTARTARRSKPPSTVYRVNDEGEPI